MGSSNQTTMAHEMGHDYGLYHTFERANNRRETVPRSGSSSNCTIAGDLLCDTEADPNSNSYNLGDYINASCQYTGQAQDSLGNAYTPPVHNIMTYGRFECRNHFTDEQRDRMHYFITNTASLINALNDDDRYISNAVNVTSGVYVQAARNTLTIAPSASTTNSYRITTFTKAHFTAKNYIDFKPGVQFSPGGGLTEAHINNLCY